MKGERAESCAYLARGFPVSFAPSRPTAPRGRRRAQARDIAEWVAQVHRERQVYLLAEGADGLVPGGEQRRQHRGPPQQEVRDAAILQAKVEVRVLARTAVPSGYVTGQNIRVDGGLTRSV